MGFEYASNIKKLVESLNKRSALALEGPKKGVVRGMEFFQSKILREQMSGRPGLNVQTGELRRSWSINSEDLVSDFISKLSTRSVYAISHQLGLTIRPKKKEYLQFKIGGSWIRTKEVHIPKRLNVIEDFKESGVRIVSREVWEEIIKAMT